jgi:hypothetical protein
MKFDIHPGTTLFVVGVAAFGALQAIQPQLTGQSAAIVGSVLAVIGAIFPALVKKQQP